MWKGSGEVKLLFPVIMKNLMFSHSPSTSIYLTKFVGFVLFLSFNAHSIESDYVHFRQRPRVYLSFSKFRNEFDPFKGLIRL